MSETISDHALIRFIERVKGVSLDPYRRELEGILDAQTKWSRDADPPEGDDHLLVVIHDTLVTILPPGTRRKRTRHDKQGYARYAPLPHPEGERT